ncbi:hypothetical protein [Aeromicrobium sp. UC242_57]|uniref:sunset domain-containing protein n=1 Tax=Aeromicrobium sp. UC242_57 TaxID=3374624 RepID=UPI0037984D3D
MSAYTLGEIAVWLVLAAVLGFVLGWLAREIQVRAGRRSAAPEVQPAKPAEPAAPAAPEETMESQPAEPEPEPEPEPELEPEPEPALIKGKKSSMIYHTPSSGSYARTKADVWFTTEDEAVAAGFRKPKNA